MQFTNTEHIRTLEEQSPGLEIGQSLLHQALKRKRTDSENERSFLKRQYHDAGTKTYFFNNNQPNPCSIKPSLLTSALTSPPKAMSSSRTVYHLITNRNSLKSSHAELVSLLKSSTSASAATSTTTTLTSQIRSDTFEEKSEIKRETDD